MLFALGIIIGAAAILIVIGCHRLITYDRYKQGFVDGYEAAKRIRFLKHLEEEQ